MSKFQEQNFKFSVDLSTAAKRQLQFLSNVDSCPLLKDEKSAIIQGAIIRYERLWLPLLARSVTKKLVPPLDVEWIWHCHLLSPHAYRDDCMDIFGEILDHQLLSTKERDDLQKETIKIWTTSYPDEPFHVDLNVNEIQCGIIDFKQRVAYDLVAAVSRQKVFYYQVSLPHYTDVKFLDEAIKRYKMYLYLKQQNPKVYLVPFYDIDLVWHSHQLHPVYYHKDTASILGGRMLNHDDTTNDRSPGSTLYNSDLETRDLWRKEFGKEIAVYGTMYRGDPPENKLHHLNFERMLSFCDRSTSIQLNDVNLVFEQLSDCPRSGRFKVHVSVPPKLLQAGKERNVVSCVSAKRHQPSWNRTNFNRHLPFSTSVNGDLYFQFSHSKGFMCTRSESFLGSHAYDISGNHLREEQIARFGNASHREFQFSEIFVENQAGGRVTLSVKGEISKPKLETCELTLSQGKFSQANMPAHIESMWGPIPLRRLPGEEENICDVAEHSLKTNMNEVKFTCRIIHSVKLMMSVVHVFFEDKMAAVAHLIGSDQLPVKNQVKNIASISLEPSRGERAVLIKNQAGDWGVVIGRWAGFKKGVPSGGRGKPGVPGCPGYLDITFHKFAGQRHSIHIVMAGLLTKRYVYEFESLKMDVKKGKIFLDPTREEMAENICLAFAISLLHVLCVPRPSNWSSGKTLKPKSSSRGTRSITTVPSEDMVFFMAAGLMVTSPSNHYIRHTFGINACAGCSGEAIGEVDCDVTGVDVSDADCVVDIGADGGDGGDGGGGCGGCGGCGAGCGGGGGGCGGGGGGCGGGGGGCGGGGGGCGGGGCGGGCGGCGG